MNARKRIEAALALCEKAGVEPGSLAAGHTVFQGSQLTLDSCEDFWAVAKAAKVKPAEGRLLGSTARAAYRIFEVIVSDDLVVVHTCWPHLSCWRS